MGTLIPCFFLFRATREQNSVKSVQLIRFIVSVFSCYSYKLRYIDPILRTRTSILTGDDTRQRSENTRSVSQQNRTTTINIT